jgi:hypothetical protein
MDRIAVAIVHGIEIEDTEFALTTIERISELFEEKTGGAVAPAEALAFEAVHWAPVLEARQVAMLDRLYPGKGHELFEEVKDRIKSLNTGSLTSLIPFLASTFKRGNEGLKYPIMRWLLMHFTGDVVAYQRGPHGDGAYDEIHASYQLALSRLKERAGAQAPLCVISHSLGTVISSNHFYDLGAKPPPGASPLELGQTLCHLFTMGSPLALWGLRYPDCSLDRPLQVPHPRLAQQRPSLEGQGGWINFFDDDDVISTPLAPLSDAYARAVKDVSVSIRNRVFSSSPLVHPFYWSDPEVLEPIADALARTWRAMKAAPARGTHLRAAAEPPKVAKING